MGTSGEAVAAACVMGDLNLVRALGLAGVPCAAAAPPGDPVRWSRFCRAAIDWPSDPEARVDALLRFGRSQPERPVLCFAEDEQLLLVSRHRAALARAFRFVIAAPELVEDLVDKSRFQALARRLGLPVPHSRLLRPAPGSRPPRDGLRYPLVIKPLNRDRAWRSIEPAGKAIPVATPDALRTLWPRLGEAGIPLLAQEEVAGPESRIESYHVYVDQDGRIAGEFTGRKIRTWPVTCGHSTALTISDAADVRALGRSLVHRLDLRGVAKIDVKRAPDGTLHLLEINPRFNLWHLLGAIAGVNLPAMVHADLTGRPRPTAGTARVGATWCHPWQDLKAARAAGVPFQSWLAWVARCDALSGVAWDDPTPILGRVLGRMWSGRRSGGYIGKSTSSV